VILLGLRHISPSYDLFDKRTKIKRVQFTNTMRMATQRASFQTALPPPPEHYTIRDSRWPRNLQLTPVEECEDDADAVSTSAS